MSKPGARRAPDGGARRRRRRDEERRRDECERILRIYGDNFEQLSTMLDRQFQMMHARASVLLGICGVLITTTSILQLFMMPRPARLEQAALLLGGGMALLAATVIVVGVLHIRWITDQPGDDVPTWLLSNLCYRDRKTRAYRIGTAAMVASMLLYELSVVSALRSATLDVRLPL
ncbi:hypothetical protein [Sorangium sp. So ce1000]|uniref:hypothetical protein n=1 Tax=Sorangium sp. So ce1000 TaxID=3133325 RepID=UPI003F617905